MISNSESKGAIVSKKADDFNAEDRINNKLLESSIHYLFGEIDEENISECVKWILYENLESKDKVLTLYINSTGGNLYEAFALIDVMKNSHHPIRTIALGSTMSAAFLIFASGTRGERYAAKNTSFMCHQFSESMSDKYHDLKATMKENDICNEKMVNILREATSLAPSVIKKKLLPPSDVYLTAQECVELGIADHLT
jgi:ATP-dependent Clp protease, protease subunit